MAKIVDKAYDMTKKIARTIFRGSPSLFTSADLNRQIEALQAQINRLECVTSVKISPFMEYDLDVTLRTHTMRFHLTPDKDSDGNTLDMHLFARGCDFNLGSQTIQTSAVSFSETNESYWQVIARLGSPTLIQFEDDPTHEISGANFQDGTSSAAADQMVYPSNVDILLRGNFSNLSENEILLAEIRIDGATGAYLIDAAFNTWNRPVGLGMKNALSSRYDSKSVITTPQLGQGFNSLFSHLFRSLVPVGTILPFYGDILTSAPAYGWVPCVPIARGSYDAPVSSFESDTAYIAYKTLYGNKITFEVINSVGFSYLRIKKAAGVDIPNLSGVFLTGAGAVSNTTGVIFYQKGDTGGEDRHTLTQNEMPSHNHTATTTGSDGTHSHTLTTNAGSGNEWGSFSRQKNTGSSDTQETTAGGRTKDGAHGHTITVGDTGGGQSHENRPRYHAVYYIMRVC